MNQTRHLAAGGLGHMVFARIKRALHGSLASVPSRDLVALYGLVTS
jgi:hypothetical protein